LPGNPEDRFVARLHHATAVVVGDAPISHDVCALFLDLAREIELRVRVALDQPRSEVVLGDEVRHNTFISGNVPPRQALEIPVVSESRRPRCAASTGL
jgi:hypothetical protein